MCNKEVSTRKDTRMRPIIFFTAVTLLGMMSLIAAPKHLSAQRNIPVDENGRSCIADVHGRAVEQRTQKGVWEHTVFATNRCNRTINLTVCYANTNDCTNLTASPGQESSTLLGIKSEQRFQYNWRPTE